MPTHQSRFHLVSIPFFPIVLTLLAAMLGGCASARLDSTAFVLRADDPRSSTWILKHLRSSGRIELTARPGTFNTHTSRVRINFGKQKFLEPQVTFALSDPSCTGFYTLVLARAVQSTQSFEYMATKLRWDEPLELRAEWRGGKLTLTINGDESRTVPFSGGLGEMEIAVTDGSIAVDKLSYIQLSD